MNFFNKKFLALFLTSASVLTAAAQESSTGYFNDNYLMRWQMNPAMGNRNGYVGFPGLGNINVAVNSNMHVTDFVYPSANGGKNIFFTNPDITAQEALSKFSNVNRLGESLGINVLQFGFKAFGGYNNVAINVKENLSLDLPIGFFSLLKEGLSNKTYEFSNLSVKAKVYAEIALNHSRDIKWVPGLRAGISLKVLLPAAMADAQFNHLQLELGEDSWNVRSNASMRLGINGIKYKTAIDERTGNRYVNGVDTDDLKYNINGFGMAVDLGAMYQWKDFTFSLAFSDLGVVKYKTMALATTNGTKEFRTDAHEIAIGDDSESWESFVDDFAPLWQLEDVGESGSESMALQGKMRAGVDYKFPFYNKLHFGLMNTTNLNSVFPMTEFRLSANVEPVKGVAASVSAAAGTYGANYGFLLSLGNKGFNFLLGMDYAALKMDKNHIPMSSNVDFHMGINFPF